MSNNNSLAQLCMAFARPYVIAGCDLYPLAAVFDTRRRTYDDVRRTVLNGCKQLTIALSELLKDQGYDLESVDREFALIGTMTCPVETRPLLGDPAAPIATLVVCLPQPERADQFLDKLVSVHKKHLIARCLDIVDLKVNVPFGGDGSVGFLIADPFNDGAGSGDLVFVTRESAEYEARAASALRKSRRPKAATKLKRERTKPVDKVETADTDNAANSKRPAVVAE